MNREFIALLVLVAALQIICSGCGNVVKETSATEPDFPPGAFPPTLTDMEYHQKDWIRTDCLTCHEEGVNNAPKLKHVSVPDIAKEAKCRTCHVFVPGSKPE